MKLKSTFLMRHESTNPEYDNPEYIPEINENFKKMWPWQKEAFELGKDARFFAAQAFCGSGKSFLQIELAIYDVVKSNYTQKQLIVVPQEHIHRGFVGNGNNDYITVKQGRKKYEWHVQQDHNFCYGSNRVKNLKEWLLTPPEKLAEHFTEQTIAGLNAVCSHSALVAAWKLLTEKQKKIAIRKLTLRIDEAHHIKHVFLEKEDFTQAEWTAIRHDSTELGAICTYFINSRCKTCKLHLTTATMYRGDRKTILSAIVRKKFVEYNLDWIEHFKRLGIATFFLQYEEFKINPIKMIIKRIKDEPQEKHYIVVPSTGQKWRDESSLNTLLKELYKIYPKERVLDLVTKSTQKINKRKLLAEPKVASEDNPSKFDAVVVCMLGREGTDWCPCSVIHNASVENSITLAVQTAGRAFRRFEGKETVKIYHYIKEFRKPTRGMTKTEIFIDRTNALLICMQFDDMNNAIIIPCIPEQEGEGRKSPSSSMTLNEALGDKYIKVMESLLQGYEFLKEKTTKNIHELAQIICEDNNITENVENIKLGLVAKLFRLCGKSPELKGIDVAFVRKNGFNLLEFHDSIHFGECTEKDWIKLRKLLDNIKVLSERERLAECKRDFPDADKIDTKYKHYGFLRRWKNNIAEGIIS